MSSTPNSGLVRRVIDLNYTNKKRASSLKWMSVNAALFAVFAYDLWNACPGRTTAMHYLEAGGALVALASLALHLWQVVPRPTAPPLTPTQRRLLGLAPQHTNHHQQRPQYSPSPVGASDTEEEARGIWLEAAALRWRGSPPSPPSPPSGPSSPHGSASGAAAAPDAFIADATSLAAYVRAQARRLDMAEASPEERAWPSPLGPAPATPPPAYQLASLDADRGPQEESSALRTPQVWRRLHLDPQRLTQWNLNLRLWLHLTIFERLVRELDAVDAALAASGAEGRVGALSVERLRALAAGACPAAASLRALLPFVEPFADQRYAVQRVRELARGGCLGAYKWNGGGSEWAGEEGRPTDAELVLHLFAAYLDGQAPGGGRAFSASHLSAAPASPPRGPRALCVHRVTHRPPHYVLVVGEETVEVCSGRNNLLHTLLVLIAALAAHEPPALRLQLGRAGLNLLWVIGR